MRAHIFNALTGALGLAAIVASAPALSSLVFNFEVLAINTDLVAELPMTALHQAPPLSS